MELKYILITAGFFVGALIFIILGFIEFRRAKGAENWLKSAGTITSSEVKTHIQAGANNVNSGRYHKYEVIVQYRYKVAGEQFNGNYLKSTRSRELYRSKDEAKVVKEQYLKGSVVDVFYNPDKWEDSCLDNSFGYKGIATYFIISLAFVVIGLIGALGKFNI